MLKKTKYLLFILAILLVSVNIKIIVYGIHQGIGQFQILYKAESLEKILNSNDFPDSLKNKLLLIQQIKQFSVDSLGLDQTKNYQKLYDQKGKPILWVVTASPPFEIKEYLWKYPLLGELGYKGFFDYEKALKEAENLKKEDYDTEISKVSAWSTLGFFQDPILSSMLYKSEGELARLIIHELTHTTIYIKDDADFNENLATFIGDNGAKLYLKRKYGENSTEYLSFLNRLNDIQKISQHMIRGATQLDSLYVTFSAKNMNESEKIQLKKSMIQTIFKTADTLSLTNKNRILNIQKEMNDANNTYFINYLMYREQQHELQQVFEEKFNSDFKLFIDGMKAKYKN
jgi:predicted aminopeptidase